MDPLDAALLVAELRDLHGKLEFVAATAAAEQEREICQYVRGEITRIFTEHGRRRRMWVAVRDDLVGEIVVAVHKGLRSTKA
jgi:hypothetical protein